MTAASVAGVYAQALLEFADEGGHREAVVESCRGLVGDHRASGALGPELIAQLDDPRLGRLKAKLALQHALAGRVEFELSRLLLLLIDHNRLGDAPAILQEAIRIADHDAGRILVLAVSAQPLSDGARAHLSAGLATCVSPHVRLEERVDPRLIGGMTLRIGDYLVDASVRRQLSDLKNHILQARLPMSTALWDDEDLPTRSHE